MYKKFLTNFNHPAFELRSSIPLLFAQCLEFLNATMTTFIWGRGAQAPVIQWSVINHRPEYREDFEPHVERSFLAQALTHRIELCQKVRITTNFRPPSTSLGSRSFPASILKRKPKKLYLNIWTSE